MINCFVYAPCVQYTEFVGKVCGIFYNGVPRSLGNCKYTRADRLRKTCDYLRLSKYGKRYSSAYFIILAKVNNKFRSRLGVTVSKKVGNARTRNRIKRVIREYFRCYIKETLKSSDINVIARKKVRDLTSAEISHYLNKIFEYVVSVRGNVW